ncbi:hypothetical protein [Paracoccus pantotrophus]|uniref:hypothetical protein n=1 Tax=Paracoccus pantotrophus TaxID=82367 RepID=UPI002012ABA3|nr:hypothetical protein [Paracoccus pantotrophus]
MRLKDSHDLSGLIRFAETDATWRPRLAKVVDEHLLPALEEFEIDFEDLAELLGEQLPWTLWGCAFEDFISRRYGKHGLSVVDAYLARGKGREGAAAREYMLGLRDAWASLYEVSEVIPGQSMKLRDLIAGTAPVTVTEHSATQSLNIWDRIAARVVPVGDHHVISGGLLIYPAAASELLFDGLRQVLKLKRGQDPKLVPEKLQGCAPLFSNAWLFSQLPGLLDPQMPDLTNTDGDDLLFCELRFPFTKGVQQAQIADMLDRMPELESCGAKTWDWLAATTRRKPGKSGGLVIGSFVDGGTVLGTITLKGKALLLNVNSRERAERGKAMIQAVAGKLLRPPLTAIQTAQQVMRDQQSQGDGRQSDGEDLPPELAREVLAEFLDNHYHAILDQPVPVLGDKTPRQAVRSAAGRKKVVDWLKHLENGSARQPGTPMANYDFSWMWDALGLMSERQ